MSEIKYENLEKGQKGYAIVEIRKNYAVIDVMFTSPQEAVEEYKKYKSKSGKFDLTEIKRK